MRAVAEFSPGSEMLLNTAVKPGDMNPDGPARNGTAGCAHRAGNHGARGHAANTIKIDKTFVDGLGQKQNATIARAVIALARALEKETIAEGIETEEPFDVIKAMGCDSAQGYWVSRPVEADAMYGILSRNIPIVARSNSTLDEPVTWIRAHGKSIE